MLSIKISNNIFTHVMLKIIFEQSLSKKQARHLIIIKFTIASFFLNVIPTCQIIFEIFPTLFVKVFFSYQFFLV